MFSNEILKGSIRPLIIKLIKENGRMYGYQITQKVKEISSDTIILTEGALYPALHKLVKMAFCTWKQNRLVIGKESTIRFHHNKIKRLPLNWKK